MIIYEGPCVISPIRYHLPRSPREGPPHPLANYPMPYLLTSKIVVWTAQRAVQTQEPTAFFNDWSDNVSSHNTENMTTTLSRLNLGQNPQKNRSILALTGTKQRFENESILLSRYASRDTSHTLTLTSCTLKPTQHTTNTTEGGARY